MQPIIATKLLHKPWYRWVVYSIAMSAFTIAVLITAISVIIPDLMRDLSIDAYRIGILSSVYSFTYAIMQIPGGSLSDRIGPKKVISIFLIIGGIGILLFSWAPNFAISVMGRTLTALGVSVLYVSQIKLIRGWFRVEEMGMVMGIGSSIQAIGSLIATPIIAFLSITIGWRFTFTIIGGIVILFSGLCWIFIYDQAPWHQGIDNHEKPSLRNQLSVFFKELIREPRFIKLFLVTLLAYGGVATVFHVWGIPFLMQAFNFTKMQASWMMALSSLFSLIGAPLIGYLSDKVIKKRMPLIVLGLFGISIPSLFIALLGTSLGIAGLVITFSVIGMTLGGVLLAYTMVNEMVPHTYSGIFSAFLNMGPYLGMSIFMLLTGKILGQSSSYTPDGTPYYAPQKYQYVFLFSAIIGIIAAIIALTVRENKKKLIQKIEGQENA